MLPVSSWPPRAPGTDLSPFGKPMCVPSGFVLPKGAWIVRTTGASVIMCVRRAYADIWGQNPARVPGTGVLPGQGFTPPQPGPITPIPLYPPRNSNATPRQSVINPPPCPTRRSWPTSDQVLEAFRAWQRKTGRTDVTGPPPGRRPPNWFGPCTDRSPAIRTTLVQPNSAGTVLADGQNVMIWGNGAMIMQAFSV